MELRVVEIVQNELEQERGAYAGGIVGVPMLRLNGLQALEFCRRGCQFARLESCRAVTGVLRFVEGSEE